MSLPTAEPLRVTPAMEAGIADRVWELSELLAETGDTIIAMANPPNAALLVDLNADMYRIYWETWKRLGSRGERFRQMIEPPKPGRSGKNYRGALETAKYLMATESKLSGLQWLKERDSLDLSVERIVLDPKYASLFSDEEKSVARRRLAAVDK